MTKNDGSLEFNQWQIIKETAFPFLIQNVHKAQHNRVNFFWSFLMFSFFLLSLALVKHQEGALTFVICCMLCAWSIFSLYILVVHEATHRMYLFPLSFVSRGINEFFPKFLVGLSFQSYDIAWKKGHFDHHQKPIAEDDPQNCPRFCHTGLPLGREILKVLIVPGYAFKKQSSCQIQGIAWREGVWSWAFILSVIAVIGNVTSLGVLLLGLNGAMALNLIKVALEHGGDVAARGDYRLRSRSSDFWGRSLLMPFHISLHFEHHYLPRVPWYQLLSLHRELRRKLSITFQEKIFLLSTSQVLKHLKGDL
jgi:fatty acid desaturase